MARAKKKSTQSKYVEELDLIESIYLDMSDDLRALRLNKISVEEKINNINVLLLEHENNKDRNRKLFHVVSLRESDIEADELRKNKFEAEQENSAIDIKIASLEKKLDALHTARKIMVKAGGTSDFDNKDPFAQTNPDGAVSVTADENPFSEKGSEDIKTVDVSAGSSEDHDGQSLSRKEKSRIKKRLFACVDSIELASRVTAFDPERARIELSAVIDTINELVSGL